MLQKKHALVAKGRGYVVSDLEQLRAFGSSSAYLSILILALYIHSDAVILLYATPQLLWVVCFIVLYWLRSDLDFGLSRVDAG